MNFSLSNLMSDYYLNSLYGNGLYGQYNNTFYLGGLYGQNNVLGNVQDYSGFQNILAASLNGQRLQNSSILEAQMQAGLNETGGKYAVIVPSEYISSYRFSGGGGQKTFPTEKESQKSREEHAENMRHQVRNHHL